MFFSLSAANSVNFSANIIRAARGRPEILKTNCGLQPTPSPGNASTLDLEWINKGTSVAILAGMILSTILRAGLSIAMIVVCLIHARTPKLGIWISNIFGAFKLVVLVIIVLTGFAALGGRLKVPKPHNFSTFHGPGTACELPPYAKSTAAANYAVAMLQVAPDFAFLGVQVTIDLSCRFLGLLLAGKTRTM